MEGERRRPNIVFVLGDDWGWGDLGCYGHQRAHTPHLDELARQGTRFTQFYVGSAVCSPSRVSFLTGRFPGECSFHTVLGDHRPWGVPDFLSTEFPTVAGLLQGAGYRTAHFGKWHVGTGEGAPDPGAYGFDVHVGSVCNGPQLIDHPEFAHLREQYPNTAAPHIPEFQPHSSRVIVDEAISFIEQAGGQPFYVQLWLHDPHATLNPTDEQMEPYRHLSPRTVDYPGSMAVYYAVLSEADRQLGRLFDRLDMLGLAEDTIVIFTGDNGPEIVDLPNASHSAAGSAGPFRGRKRSLYEGGVRMPLIVRWPGQTPPNQVDDDSVLSSVDLLPSLCALAGATVPARTRLCGVDAGPALRGERFVRTEPLMWENRLGVVGDPLHQSPMLAIHDGGWKLLMNPDRSRVELYDIRNDPMELTNLAERHPDTVDALAEQVLAWHYTLPEGPVHELAGTNTYPWPTP